MSQPWYYRPGRWWWNPGLTARQNLAYILWWGPFHKWAPHWAIHRWCDMCRKSGVCARCIPDLDWEEVEVVVRPPKDFQKPKEE